MMAVSAKRMASVAPRSMPAGLSQITQSNICLSEFMHARDAFFGQRVLVAGLRGGEECELFEALVADERLRELGDHLASR